MLYVILGEDVEHSLAARQAVRASHVARLQELQRNGRLVLAGPCPAIDNPEPGTAGFTGSVIVAEFPSLDDAQRWANQDPYIAGGVYRTVSVRPFKQVFP